MEDVLAGSQGCEHANGFSREPRSLDVHADSLRQLTLFCFSSVTQQRFYVRTTGVGIVGWRHERTVQKHVNLAKQRMHPVVHGTYRRILIYVCSVRLDNACSNHEVRFSKRNFSVSHNDFYESQTIYNFN